MPYRSTAALMKDGKRVATRRYAWMVWLEPAVVLMLAPVFLFPSPRRSIFFVFLLLLFVLHFLARRRIVESSPANAPLILILVMVVVSLYATYDIIFSLPKIAGILLGAAVFFAIVNSVNSSRLLKTMIIMLILSSIGLSALGLLGTKFEVKIPILRGITAHLEPRIKGLPGAEEGFSPNAIGGGLVLFLPLQFALAFSFWRNCMKRRLMLVIFASLLISGSVLLLTQARGAWFGLAIALLLLLVLSYPWGKWLSLAVLTAAAMLIFWLGPANVGNKIMGSIGNPSKDVGSYVKRLEIWNRAIYGITDFPFTGMGMNTFRKVVHVLYPFTILIEPDFDIASCHNQFMQTALDLGIPGLIAYIALLAAAITMGIQVWHRCAESWIRASAQGLVCGIVAQQVFGLTDAIPLGAKVGIFFWVALGTLAAMHRLVEMDPHDSSSHGEASARGSS